MAVEQTKKNNLSICTIISKNYLPYARVVAESFLKHNKGDVFVLLVDKIDGYFNPAEEKFRLIELEELKCLIPDFQKFCFQYTILELNTAVKPYLLEFLLKKYGMEKLAYFDPDILITNNLDELSKLLDECSIVLTPHMTAPVEDEYKPDDLDILRNGTYNLGFIALSNREQNYKFLNWWQRRLHNDCVVAFEKGLFVDQKWIDLVPGFYEDVFILREPGYNVAYWNYHCRNVSIESGNYFVNGKPAYFFHFSGFDPENIKPVSKYQNRFNLSMLENMRPIFEYYRDIVLKSGWSTTRKWPYYYGAFDNGIKIPPFARRMYLEMGDRAKKFGNPFLSSGDKSYFTWLSEKVKAGHPVSRLFYSIYQARPDVQKTFPDIFGKNQDEFLAWAMTSGRKDYSIDAGFFKDIDLKEEDIASKARYFIYNSMRVSADMAEKKIAPLLQHNQKVLKFIKKVNERLPVAISVKPPMNFKKALSFSDEIGVNISGYISSESGMGEAVRSEIRALSKTKIPYKLINLPSPSNQGDTTYSDFSEENPYNFNLVHVNADQVPFFFKKKGRDFFKSRYNIGFWIWELPEFPLEWEDRFRYFDEIWTASSFCADAFSRVSDLPVIRIPHSVEINSAGANRSQYGLNEETFIFLFMFDYLSYLERKNPLAVIEAFRAAFSPGENVLLLLKCSNYEKNARARSKLLEAAKGLNVKFMDSCLSKKDINSLLAMCDCYISLHRSEGFGLPLAEAMCLKKPVIATGFSGNMDFMNVNNSFPVKYRLVEIEEDIGPYKKGNIWAEPDIKDAAKWMRFVFDNREAAKKVGEQASEDIKKNFSPVVIGDRIKRRLDCIKTSLQYKSRILEGNSDES